MNKFYLFSTNGKIYIVLPFDGGYSTTELGLNTDIEKAYLAWVAEGNTAEEWDNS